MTKTQKEQFEELTRLSKKIGIYTSISLLLEWDQETKMPKDAITLRSKQNELIASLIHKEKISPHYSKILSSLIDLDTGVILAKDLSPKEIACLKRMQRDYFHAHRLPTAFIEEFAKATSDAMHVWQETKPKSDFKTFAPYLKKIIELNQRKADFYGFDDHPYDALLDVFEPGMRTKTLTTLFERLKIPLSNLLKKIQMKPDPDRSFLQQAYAHDLQFKFVQELLKDMGFTKGNSRLDESAHPMCVPIHPSDMRMTTRIYAQDVCDNILSVAHEGGHGLYHIHLPKEHFGTPLCEPASLGIDESQSRTWETLVARSFSFWEHYFPRLQQFFPKQLGPVDLFSFYQAINIVEPSMIRVQSDEVCYNLHIMLRFEIEKKILENRLKVEDIPEAWNELMRSYLGIFPKAHSEGCMQDIHWSMGAIGYFPTYTLGNLYAAQFFEAFTTAHPDWKKDLSMGNLQVLSDWQKKHIHQYGAQYLPGELCEKVTSKPLTETAYIEHLETKYTSLYHL